MRSIIKVSIKVSKTLKAISGLLISLGILIYQRDTLKIKKDVTFNDTAFHGQKLKKRETVTAIR